LAELPFSLFNSAEPSLLTLTEALESVEEEESVLFLELPHAARVNKARTETDAKVNLENTFIIISLFY